MEKLSTEEGKLAVSIARNTLDVFVSEGERFEPGKIPEIFKKDRGVFVTLSNGLSGDLRGCIGFPEPVAPFIDALIDAAISAASRDPRFYPVELNELDLVIVEVSALTPPVEIEVKSPDEYLKKIKVGRDGLIITKGFSSGLLLPQVPVEWGWNKEEYLAQLCRKAGLAKDAWRESGVVIERFEAQVWTEDSPRGEIVQKPL